MTKRVYLYAFNSLCGIADYKFLEGDAITVMNMQRLADWMVERAPFPIKVYAVDNRPGLYQDFKDATDLRFFDKRLMFADMVSREGIRIR